MNRSISIILACVLACSCSPKDNFIFLSGDYLETVAQKVESNPDLPAFRNLISLADSLLDVTPKSVMDKTPVPPSGDKHDYMSMGIYWWPNPDTPDGLPYIRKDGQTNPEIKKITDCRYASTTIKDVEQLSLAYRFSGDERYAAKASELLRVWFLDPATRMNPNMNFAQGIPGVCEGRGTGIIDLSLRLPFLYDYVNMLGASRSWTRTDDKALKAWTVEFVNWLETSEYGLFELDQKNNHGTNYDVLLIASYLFIGEKGKAAGFARQFSFDRYDQIAADGAQPRELERTKAWNYVLNNTRALLHLAKAAEVAGVDYWTYTNPEGASVQTAIDWIAPYMTGEKDWDYQDIRNAFASKNIVDILCFAYGHLDLTKFRTVIDGIDRDSTLLCLSYELR